jgi:rhamnogalacturonyl hydrolase YesR
MIPRQQRKSTARRSATADRRTPLEIAEAIARRFMKIYPPPTSYMYGVGMRGILNLYRSTRNEKYLDFYLRHYQLRKPRLDWMLYDVTGDRKWLEGLEENARKWLANTRRDREGVLLDPRGRYTVDVFSGHFTVPIIYGAITKDPRFFDEALHHFKVYQSYLEDPSTGVWYSRWGHSLHPNRPNPGLWSRGNGWLASAWGEVMHLWDRAHPGYRTILKHWQEYCRSIAAFQTPSGMFRQLLNRPNSFEETSGTGLFCEGFARGVAHKTLPAEFATVAWRAFCGLRAVTDRNGNIHNSSTLAGGYNFERQYESCPRFNEPHANGTVMSACAALHDLLQKKVKLDRTEPSVRPVIVTRPISGCITQEPSERCTVDDLVPPVLKRIGSLTKCPPNDRFGGIIGGLLHWHDHSRDAAILSQARDLFERWKDGLSPVVRWNLDGEIALRSGDSSGAKGMKAFVDAELARMPRDRTGVWLDEAGGYRVEQLFVWLPLLAKVGAATGDTRYFDEAWIQLRGHQRWLEDPLTKFWYSAFGHGQHPRRVNPGLWAMGNGYVLGGAVGLLIHLPRTHEKYADVVCLVRGLVDALHDYLPVTAGWHQVLDRFDTFACVGATGLLTYGAARAIHGGWALAEYYAIVAGGKWYIGELTDSKANYGPVSLPTGGLDTADAYEKHRTANDPAVLGYLLSACAYSALADKAGRNLDGNDKQLGAR